MMNAEVLGMIKTSLTKMTSLTKTRGFSKTITKSDMLNLLQQDTSKAMRRSTMSPGLKSDFSRDNRMSLTMKTTLSPKSPDARQSLRFGTLQELKEFEPAAEQDVETYRRSYKLAMLAYFSNMSSTNFKAKK